MPLIALNGYQAFNGSLGAGSVKVSFVSLSIIMYTDSPKKVIVTQPKTEINMVVLLEKVSPKVCERASPHDVQSMHSLKYPFVVLNTQY